MLSLLVFVLLLVNGGFGRPFPNENLNHHPTPIGKRDCTWRSKRDERTSTPDILHCTPSDTHNPMNVPTIQLPNELQLNRLKPVTNLDPLPPQTAPLQAALPEPVQAVPKLRSNPDDDNDFISNNTYEGGNSLGSKEYVPLFHKLGLDMPALMPHPAQSTNPMLPNATTDDTAQKSNLSPLEITTNDDNKPSCNLLSGASSSLATTMSSPPVMASPPAAPSLFSLPCNTQATGVQGLTFALPAGLQSAQIGSPAPNAATAYTIQTPNRPPAAPAASAPVVPAPAPAIANGQAYYIPGVSTLSRPNTPCLAGMNTINAPMNSMAPQTHLAPQLGATYATAATAAAAPMASQYGYHLNPQFRPPVAPTFNGQPCAMQVPPMNPQPNAPPPGMPYVNNFVFNFNTSKTPLSHPPTDGSEHYGGEPCEDTYDEIHEGHSPHYEDRERYDDEGESHGDSDSHDSESCQIVHHYPPPVPHHTPCKDHFEAQDGDLPDNVLNSMITGSKSAPSSPSTSSNYVVHHHDSKYSGEMGTNVVHQDSAGMGNMIPSGSLPPSLDCNEKVHSSMISSGKGSSFPSSEHFPTFSNEGKENLSSDKFDGMLSVLDGTGKENENDVPLRNKSDSGDNEYSSSTKYGSYKEYLKEKEYPQSKQQDSGSKSKGSSESDEKSRNRENDNDNDNDKEWKEEKESKNKFSSEDKEKESKDKYSSDDDNEKESKNKFSMDDIEKESKNKFSSDDKEKESKNKYSSDDDKEKESKDKYSSDDDNEKGSKNKYPNDEKENKGATSDKEPDYDDMIANQYSKGSNKDSSEKESDFDEKDNDKFSSDKKADAKVSDSGTASFKSEKESGSKSSSSGEGKLVKSTEKSDMSDEELLGKILNSPGGTGTSKIKFESHDSGSSGCVQSGGNNLLADNTNSFSTDELSNSNTPFNGGSMSTSSSHDPQMNDVFAGKTDDTVFENDATARAPAPQPCDLPADDGCSTCYHQHEHCHEHHHDDSSVTYVHAHHHHHHHHHQHDHIHHQCYPSCCFNGGGSSGGSSCNELHECASTRSQNTSAYNTSAPQTSAPTNNTYLLDDKQNNATNESSRVIFSSIDQICSFLKGSAKNTSQAAENAGKTGVTKKSGICCSRNKKHKHHKNSKRSFICRVVNYSKAPKKDNKDTKCEKRNQNCYGCHRYYQHHHVQHHNHHHEHLHDVFHHHRHHFTNHHHHQICGHRHYNNNQWGFFPSGGTSKDSNCDKRNFGYDGGHHYHLQHHHMHHYNHHHHHIHDILHHHHHHYTHHHHHQICGHSNHGQFSYFHNSRTS